MIPQLATASKNRYVIRVLEVCSVQANLFFRGQQFVELRFLVILIEDQALHAILENAMTSEKEDGLVVDLVHLPFDEQLFDLVVNVLELIFSGVV